MPRVILQQVEECAQLAANDKNRAWIHARLFAASASPSFYRESVAIARFDQNLIAWNYIPIR